MKAKALDDLVEKGILKSYRFINLNSDAWKIRYFSSEIHKLEKFLTSKLGCDIFSHLRAASLIA